MKSRKRKRPRFLRRVTLSSCPALSRAQFRKNPIGCSLDTVARRCARTYSIITPHSTSAFFIDFKPCQITRLTCTYSLSVFLAFTFLIARVKPFVPQYSVQYQLIQHNLGGTGILGATSTTENPCFTPTPSMVTIDFVFINLSSNGNKGTLTFIFRFFPTQGSVPQKRPKSFRAQ